MIFFIEISGGGLKSMHQLPRNMFQSLSDELKLECWILVAPHHIWSGKVLMETTNLSILNLPVFLQTFSCNYEAATAKTYVEWFWGALKITKQKEMLKN